MFGRSLSAPYATLVTGGMSRARVESEDVMRRMRAWQPGGMRKLGEADSGRIVLAIAWLPKFPSAGKFPGDISGGIPGTWRRLMTQSHVYLPLHTPTLDTDAQISGLARNTTPSAVALQLFCAVSRRYEQYHKICPLVNGYRSIARLCRRGNHNRHIDRSPEYASELCHLMFM